MLLPKLNYNGSYQWELPASKSLSNRWLIINYLCGESLEIENLSQADDTMLLKQMLEQLKAQENNTFHCKNAGTVARFITALLATQKGTFVVTGDERMKQRPMAELLDALRSIGADIRCLEQESFLPVEIRGTRLKGGEVRLSGMGSSQFASALLLVAQTMERPLTIKFDNRPVSKAYISTTCESLKTCGHDVLQKPLEITVRPVKRVNPFPLLSKTTGVLRLTPTMWWLSHPTPPSFCRGCTLYLCRATELCGSGTKDSACTPTSPPKALF